MHPRLPGPVGPMLLLLLLICGIWVVPCPTRARAAEPEAAEIRELIRQLGSDQFMERETAGKRLEAIGLPALPLLRKAADSEDPEVRQRAAQLVEGMERRLAGEVRCFVGHEHLINDVAFSPDGRRIASAGWDRTV